MFFFRPRFVIPARLTCGGGAGMQPHYIIIIYQRGTNGRIMTNMEERGLLLAANDVGVQRWR